MTLEELTAHLAPRTREAYLADWAAIGRALEAPVADVLLRALSSRAEGAAVQWELVARMRDEWAPATLRRRVASYRAALLRAHQAGLIDWQPPPLRLPRPPRRRTKSPLTLAELRRLVVVAERALRPDHGARLVAALRLAFDAGLRAAELLALELEHLDRAGGWIVVPRKGGEVARLALAAPTLEALDLWMMRRPSVAGSRVFVSLEGAHIGQPWTRRSFAAQLAAFSRRVLGRSCSPHDLRHAGITAALDATGGDARRVQRWAGHLDIRQTLAYDDDRRDTSREVAELVAAQLFVPPRQLTISAAALTGDAPAPTPTSPTPDRDESAPLPASDVPHE